MVERACPSSCLRIKAVVTLLLVCGVLVWPAVGGLRGQDKGVPPQAAPPAPVFEPVPTPQLPPGTNPEIVQKLKAEKLRRQLALEETRDLVSRGERASRFPLTIEPNTPIKDLLPVPPNARPISGPQLSDDLSSIPEVEFQAAPGKNQPTAELTKQTVHTMARINHLNAKKSDGFLEALLGERTDLNGLPFAMGDACRIKGERSKQFTLAANLIRQQLPQNDKEMMITSRMRERGEVMAPMSASLGKDRARAEAFWTQYQTVCVQADQTQELVDRQQKEHVALARVAALMQVLAPESAHFRLGLVKYLSGVQHSESTKALARLAVFSREDDVRQAAIEALKVRRERDYTEVLLQGLRYPLPAVARRAGDTLVKLERTDLVPQLVDLLEEPDPRAPVVKETGEKKVATVRELVRVNHHKNCLLCHAPANTGTVAAETLTAPVPVPNEPLPSPFEGYNRSQQFPDILVRIDVTYLRQDFSAYLAVTDAHPWPEMQRFDFLVRTRELTDQEAAAYRQKLGERDVTRPSPYNRAVLAALRDLTGRDAEPTPEAWRKMLELPAPKRRVVEK
jgi:hypothetical protein